MKERTFSTFFLPHVLYIHISEGEDILSIKRGTQTTFYCMNCFVPKKCQLKSIREQQDLIRNNQVGSWSVELIGTCWKRTATTDDATHSLIFQSLCIRGSFYLSLLLHNFQICAHKPAIVCRFRTLEKALSVVTFEAKSRLLCRKISISTAKTFLQYFSNKFQTIERII